jgi:gliding motility-associated-like protein
MLRNFLLVTIILFYSILANAQCGTLISTFPYNQDFESTNGGWVSGGLGNDWAWGAPNKPVIATAGGGTKCWIVGGLTNSSYNLGARSFVSSPCFDFTNVPYPHISIKVFWETENIYDGATLQYSTNAGTSWTNVGAFGDSINCLNDNWYNQGNLTNLTTLATPKHGWAGNVQSTSGSCQGGNGSATWVTAQHCMSYLGGLPSVKFRIAFGAGTNCNAYDGFAFDDVIIKNAPPNIATFSNTCNGNGLQYQFTGAGTPCPSSYAWNFGDATSGTNNISTLKNPIHTFTAGGSYTVTYTVSGPCNKDSTITKVINVLSATTATTKSCFGLSTGSITTTAASGTNFILNPGAVTNTTGIFNNLASGNYTITISNSAGCSITKATAVTQNAQITFSNMVASNLLCNNANNGTITGNSSNGIAPLSYSITPGGVSNPTINFTGLSANTFTITATDANSCIGTTTAIITNPAALQFNSIILQHVQCFGQANGKLNITMLGGTGAYNYNLTPGNIANSTGIYNTLGPATYTINVKDANNCNIATTVTITMPLSALNINKQLNFASCASGNDGSATITATGGTPTYLYALNNNYGTTSTFSNLGFNIYTLSVKDLNNCVDSVVVNLTNPDVPNFNNAIANNTICYGTADGSIQVNASGNNPVANYILTPGNIINTTGTYNNLSAGTYTVTAVDNKQCKNTTLLNIVSPNIVSIIINSVNAVGCESISTASASLSAVGGNGTTYIYNLTPGNIVSLDGKYTNLASYTYNVTATDGKGCTGSIILPTSTSACCDKVGISNAFSPNNDTQNDKLKMPTSGDISNQELHIFDRFGTEVFSSKDPLGAWDGSFNGQDVEMGTYFYFIKYTCTSNNKAYLLKGDLNVIR